MLQRIAHTNGVVFYRSPLIAHAGVPHGFSTRIGGVSSGIFASMNLGNPLGSGVSDEPGNIEENYRRLQSALGAPQTPRCWLHQVHGGDVVMVREGHEFTNATRADALVGNDSTRVLAVRVADCVPILAASEDGAVVAAIHAGWRGVVANIVANTLREMRRLTGSDIVAAVGPCISQCNFEVGLEVLDQFKKVFSSFPELVVHDGNGKGHVDLPRAAHKQLMDAGLTADQIDTTDRCSFQHADEFFSHRRDAGVTGRMAALIAPVGR